MWRRRLFAWEEESARECSAFLHGIVLQENNAYRWRWLMDPINRYTVKGTYHFLTMTEPSPHRVLYHDIWQKYIPLKVNVFAWRIIRNSLPTKDNLIRRRILPIENNLCRRMWFGGDCRASFPRMRYLYQCVVIGFTVVTHFLCCTSLSSRSFSSVWSPGGVSETFIFILPNNLFSLCLGYLEGAEQPGIQSKIIRLSGYFRQG